MKKILIIFVAALLLWSCSDNGPDTQLEDADVVELTLRFPSMETETLDSRAGSTIIPGVDNLWVVFIGSNNVFLSKSEIKPEDIVHDGSDYRLQIVVPKQAVTLSLVANTGELMASEDADRPMSEVKISGFIPITDNQIMHGSVSIAQIKSAVTTVNITRMVAKTTLLSEVSDFEILDVASYGAAGIGTISKSAISTDNHTAETDATKTAEGFVWYNYETTYGASADSHVKIVVHASYKGNEGYYPVAYYREESEEHLPLERNHHYTIRITRVNATGYKTREEAKAAEPENRLSVDVKDDHNVIYDMIACKDYELGVGKEVRCAWNSEIADISFVTTIKDGQYKIEDINCNWCTGWEIVKSTPVDADPYHDAGVMYIARLSLSHNEASEDERSFNVTISSGDLTRTVVVTQEGRDFKRDDMRPVEIKNLKATGMWSDYFDFLDNELNGARPEDMRGVVRNQGLHFSVGQNRYEYRIKKLDISETVDCVDSRFSVTEDSGYWVVKLSNNAQSDDMWVSQFVISTPQRINIAFPVYRTGVIDYIDVTESGTVTVGGTTKSHPYQQMSEVTGWFYYEQVKVKNQDIYILDRNIGATTNEFYSPNISDLARNGRAVGAYFKISLEKPSNVASDGTLSDKISPAGYTLPENAETFKNLIKWESGITVENTSYNIYYIETEMATENGMIDTKTYIPISGYYEGTSHKNTSHACLWSKECLSGAQGFDPTSPEYKYWYMYITMYNHTIGISNMRFVNGGAGSSTGTGYKGMPVRCVRM
ncbi:MAG: hypothetical protein K2L30_05405 [Duncaniella sp.]|nr:hypothetical protein [Duncaniella sp.]